MFDIIFLGLSLGSILLLVALGLAITFGAMGVINLAHGEMVMIGAYTAVLCRIHFDLGLLAAIPIAFVAAALVGLAIERLIIRKLYGRILDTLLATWGLSILLQQAVRLEMGLSFFGVHIDGLGSGLQKVDVPHWMVGAVQIGSVDLNIFRVFILVVAVLLTSLTGYLLYYTSIGMQLRAIMRNPKMAAASGIDVSRINSLTFAYGSGLAGVAGVMMAGFKTVFPDMGTALVVDGFLAVVVGGVGSLAGTIAAAALLGQINSLFSLLASDVVARAVVFTVVVAIITFRPKGLFFVKGR